MTKLNNQIINLIMKYMHMNVKTYKLIQVIIN
jgi:hypothetical protein